MPDVGVDTRLKPYKFIVRQDGSVYRVIRGDGTLQTAYTNPATAIQYAFDNLTVGRTYQERVLLVGDFVIASTVLMPSLVDIEVQGRIKQADGAESSTFTNTTFTAVTANQNHHITVHGGEWDGNFANNPGGSGNYFIKFETAQNIDCHDMYMHDGKWGISFQGCLNVRCHNIQGKTFRGLLLGFDASVTYSVSGQNCVWTNCIAESCGVNGFWGHGLPAAHSYGLSITNCVAHDCLYAGIYLDEKLWGYECVGNFCYANGDSTTSGANIWANGEQDGVPYFASRWNTITGNVCYQSKNDGMYITKGAYVLVSSNVLVESRWNGFFADGMHHCMLVNNMVVNNSQQTAGTWQGIDLRSLTGPDAVLYTVHDNTIRGNLCTDNQGTKTQQYGIRIRSTDTAFNNIIEDNDVRGNRAGLNLGIDTADLSNCYNNKGFRTKRGRYTAVHPTEGCEGILQGTISTFTNAANATIAKTIDSTGTHMTYTTSTNTVSDTCGAKVTKITERDLQPTLKCKFRHVSGNVTRCFIGFHSNADTNLTTIASILGSNSGIGIYIDGQINGNYRLLTNDGSGSSANTDSVLAFDTSVHELQILCDNGSGVMFVLDNVLLTGAKITSQVPAVGTDLGIYWAIQTQINNASKVLDIWDVEVIMKD